MSKGNIVLIPFPYTDLSGSKLRPALVLAETALDVMVSFITSQIQWQEPTDVILNPNLTNGIKKTSLVRLGKIATIKKQLITGRLGNLSKLEVADVNQKLKIILQI